MRCTRPTPFERSVARRLGRASYPENRVGRPGRRSSSRPEALRRRDDGCLRSDGLCLVLGRARRRVRSVLPFAAECAFSIGCYGPSPIGSGTACPIPLGRLSVLLERCPRITEPTSAGRYWSVGQRIDARRERARKSRSRRVGELAECRSTGAPRTRDSGRRIRGRSAPG
jgi:hypothetical protein